MSDSISIEVDISDPERELDRLGRDPDFPVLLSFESTLQAQFAVTKAAVHVDTGSLLLSGRADTDYRHGVLEGTISFGGASTGVHDPVTYAKEELARGDRPNRHGSSHYFFAAVEDGFGDQEYVNTILEHLKGAAR